MAKKSSKASTPSWRTLMRQAKDAEKLGHKIKATQLRAQASQARKGTRKTSTPRSEVMKKAWETRRAKAMLEQGMHAGNTDKKFNPPPAPRTGFSTVTGEDRAYTVKTQAAPGHGEIVGGAEHQFAEEIAKLARKKGGKDAIQKKISERIEQATAVGQSLAERTQNGAMQRMHEAHTDKVVCSAIGAFEQQMKLFNGLPPSVVMSSYTICRMLDALNRAGYSANGKK